MSSDVVISVESLSKQYRLGVIGSSTIREDLHRWWDSVRLRGGSQASGLRSQVSNEIWALRDVSFEVQQGEILGIIGRNGAGKSTLLKILSRVTAPTSGSIKVKGRIASLLEVGTGFHPELTGRDNIYLNGAILGMSKAEIARKFDEIVAFSEVEKFIDTPVKRYSSGMYVRLAFAVAAHLEPEILIVDEVLAVGDLAFQKKCLGKIGAVASEGRTVLFVSHNMSAILNLCTRAILVQKGSIAEQGAPQEIVHAYQLIASANPDNPHADIGAERKGSGVVRVTSIVPFSSAGDSVMLNGMPGGIAFHYESQTLPLRVQVAFGLINSLGEYCLHCSTDTLHQTLTLDHAKGVIMCSIPRCPLIPDDYTLNFMLRDAGGGLLDYIQNAACIRVSPGDFYGTGRLPALGLGSVVIDYSFHGEGKAC